ncbi:nickel-binding protein [Christiangramia sp.]|uniref:nickel-binding protein n=1 Tax=Christiangramia sp. TaxID=1931228 RepID=UPI00260A0A1E|nr:nickel-binding protein [Christiangramia sp.]
MPIYMDRHDVSKEVTAEIVAELHQKDLKIQHRFNCKGLTYWFDDKRKTAFCLVEAPNKAAIKEMHDQAHGEVPHRIIEVDNAIVESFLGRIEDPEKSQKTELNIINDPAFRVIMVVGVKPSSFRKVLDEKVNLLIKEQNSEIIKSLSCHDGRLVKINQDHFLISFDSVTNAIKCALEIQLNFKKNFNTNHDSPVKLKMSLNGGVPVDEKEGFFENTIKTAQSYYDLVVGKMVLSTEVKELYESENSNNSIASDSFVTLNPSEEKFLKDLVNFTEKEWCNPTLNIRDFTQYFGYSKSKLYRKIITLTGKSPNIFLKDYRLTKALQLLNKKDLNVSEVAFETGFNSLAYFSKCFQESFGILPSQYLKSRFL